MIYILVLIIGFVAMVHASELSGFIDISDSRPGSTEGSKLFYWFTPAVNARNALSPLLIWLQGKLGVLCCIPVIALFPHWTTVCHCNNAFSLYPNLPTHVIISLKMMQVVLGPVP